MGWIITFAQKRSPFLRTPPAFRFVAPLGRRYLQGTRGHARRAVALGVEARKVLPDDFPGGEPLDPLRPAFQLVTIPLGSSMKSA